MSEKMTFKVSINRLGMIHGVKLWYLNGKLHRRGAPAIEFSSGQEVWCIDGEYHREDGPAIYGHRSISGHIIKSWYLNGEELTEEQHKKRVNSYGK